MGLDMYLSARKRVSDWTFNTAEQKQEYATLLDAMGLDRDDVDADVPLAHVQITVGSWRKANQIHNWIVENVQDKNDDCQEYYIEREKLADIVLLCEEVLADKETAPDVLPVASGLFFGRDEYDDWYFEQLEDTAKMLRKVLANERLTDYDFIYRASW